MLVERQNAPDFNLQDMKQMIDVRLHELTATSLSTVLTEAMQYAVLAPGKRIRPLLCLAIAQFCGLNERNLLDVACAIEIVHAASLVFDDLPCMDNDAVRRNQQSTHVRFGEPVAILAGISLLTHAYATIAKSHTLDSNVKLKIVAALSDTAGAQGLSLGQHIDLSLEEPSAQTVTRTHHLKTGVLFGLAARIPCIAAECEAQMRQDIDAFALNLGLAFQLLDDIKDAGNTETNLVDVIGASDSQNRLQTYLKQARFAIAGYDNGYVLDNFIKAFFPA